MLLKDNSEVSILIYCDWLEDNNQSQLSNQLRKDLSTYNYPPWVYEYGVGSGGGVGGVGGDGGGGVGGVGGGGVGGGGGVSGV